VGSRCVPATSGRYDHRMGAWSGEPFGNDTAADWVWELDESSDWDAVRDALDEVLEPGDFIDADDASSAIAAAAVVARGLTRGVDQDGAPLTTNADDESDDDDDEDENDDDQDDDDVADSITAFLDRAGEPPVDVVQLALNALNAATGPTSELSDLWAESGDTEWSLANAKLRTELGG
jgi:Domain of unknown function (DUF4259)